MTRRSRATHHRRPRIGQALALATTALALAAVPAGAAGFGELSRTDALPHVVPSNPAAPTATGYAAAEVASAAVDPANGKLWVWANPFGQGNSGVGALRALSADGTSWGGAVAGDLGGYSAGVSGTVMLLDPTHDRAYTLTQFDWTSLRTFRISTGQEVARTITASPTSLPVALAVDPADGSLLAYAYVDDGAGGLANRVVRVANDLSDAASYALPAADPLNLSSNAALAVVPGSGQIAVWDEGTTSGDATGRLVRLTSAGQLVAGSESTGSASIPVPAPEVGRRSSAIARLQGRFAVDGAGRAYVVQDGEGAPGVFRSTGVAVFDAADQPLGTFAPLGTGNCRFADPGATIQMYNLAVDPRDDAVWVLQDTTTTALDKARLVKLSFGAPDGKGCEGTHDPVARLTPSKDVVDPGATLTLDGSASGDEDFGNAITEYRWDVDGNGTVDQTTTTPTLDLSFGEPGIYAPALRVKANDGKVSAFASTQIEVQGAEPDPGPGGGGGGGGTNNGGGGGAAPNNTNNGGGGQPQAKPKPTVPPAGVVAASAKAGKRLVTVALSCAPGAACAGKVTLKAGVKAGGKTKTVVLGTGSYTLAAGKKRTLTVKLSTAGVRALKKARRLKVQVVVAVTGGKAVTRTVTLRR